MPKDKDKSGMIKKVYAAKIEVDDEDRTVTATINTLDVDRDHEVVMPKGAILDWFLKNPVVLWAHNSHEPPIAKALWIKQTKSKIIAKAQFATREISEKADDIYKLYKHGFLRAFSVGFIPRKQHRPEPDEIKKRPALAEVFNIIDEWEMLEFSGVPIPSNPAALATAVKSKDITLSKETINDLDLEDEEIYYPTESGVAKIKKPGEFDMDDVEKISKMEFKQGEELEIAGNLCKVIKLFNGTDKAKAIEVEKVAVEVEKIPVEVETFIDVQAVIDEEVKRKKGVMYK